MAHAFVALAPLRFLWAMKQAGLPQGLQLSDIPLGDNCMIVPWVDQNDVLGHPNTRAFVSHAGLHSVYEAAFHGVPLAAVPFHFESLDQALKLAHRGAAVISRHAPAPRAGDSQLAYTRQAVVELMREVLHNSSYTAAAEALSGALQEHVLQRHPFQRAADEIELALATAAAAAAVGDATAAEQQQGQDEPMGRRTAAADGAYARDNSSSRRASSVSGDAQQPKGRVEF